MRLELSTFNIVKSANNAKLLLCSSFEMNHALESERNYKITKIS